MSKKRVHVRHYLGKEVIVSGQLNQSNQFRLHGMRCIYKHPVFSSMTSWQYILLLCSNGECQDLQRATVSVTPLFLHLDPMQVLREAWICGCRAVRGSGSLVQGEPSAGMVLGWGYVTAPLWVSEDTGVQRCDAVQTGTECSELFFFFSSLPVEFFPLTC